MREGPGHFTVSVPARFVPLRVSKRAAVELGCVPGGSYQARSIGVTDALPGVAPVSVGVSRSPVYSAHGYLAEV